MYARAVDSGIANSAATTLLLCLQFRGTYSILTPGVYAVGLQLNPVIFKSEGQFIGREAPKNRLLNILVGQRGGTILIAGNRGAGKTALILQGLKEANRKINSKGFRKYWQNWSWLPNRLVAIHVPLIPGDTPPEELRGVILRALVHSLHAEAWSAMPHTWVCRPVGYLRDLRKIHKLSLYKSLTHKHGITLGVGSGKLDSTLHKVVEAELDLSAINIELALRELFKKHARLLTFVVVFDEIDKYETTQHKLTADRFVFELKNLFTLSKAHFIFTSTETYLRELQRELRQEEDSAKSTLFNHKFLLNQFSPEDFERLIGTLIIGKTKGSDEFVQALMWDSNLYPAALISRLQELAVHDGKGDAKIDLRTAKEEMAEIYAGQTVQHKVISLIYNKRKSSRDTYYNRYLYRCLKTALLNFGLYTNIQLARENLAGVIFWNDTFVSDADRQAFLSQRMSKNNIPKLDDPASWKLELFNLNYKELHSIGEAITDICWYFDHIDCLIVIPHPRGGSSDHFINVVLLADGPTYDETDRLPKALASSNKLEKANLAQLERAQLKIKQGLRDKNKRTPGLFGIEVVGDRPLVDSFFRLRKEQYYRFSDDAVHDRDALVELHETIDNIFHAELLNDLKEKFVIRRTNQPFVQSKVVVIKGKRKDILLILRFADNEAHLLEQALQDYAVLSLHRPHTMRLKAFRSRVTLFVLDEEWSNMRALRRELAAYLATHATQKTAATPR